MGTKKAGFMPFIPNVKFRKSYRHRRNISDPLRGLSLVSTAWLLTLFLYGHVSAREKTPVVPHAKLQIDPAQLEHYKPALREEIETSMRIEPGVLNSYALSEKDNPSHITIFEIYANQNAYKPHLEKPHFKKYKRSTKEMVKSLDLVEAVPFVLGAKGKR